MANDDISLLCTAEAATFLKVRPRTLRAWRKRNGPPFIRLPSGAIRYPIADLRSWLDRHQVHQDSNGEAAR
jgi:Helix-turn-helix domain